MFVVTTSTLPLPTSFFYIKTCLLELKLHVSLSHLYLHIQNCTYARVLVCVYIYMLTHTQHGKKEKPIGSCGRKSGLTEEYLWMCHPSLLGLITLNFTKTINPISVIP